MVTEGGAKSSLSNDETCLLSTGIVHVGSFYVLLLPGGVSKNSDSPPPFQRGASH